MALLPIAVFLVVYIGISIIYNDFYVMSVVVAFLIAILVACLQNRKVKFDEKLQIMTSGIADKNILTMILIFLAAGIFAGTLGRDSADSVANLLLSFIPAKYSALVLFIVACFVSTAMGTSCGTIVVIGPIACALAGKTGVSLALCMASVVGGSMFGDNLSFISDTTIAATTTQGCKMKDKFKMNFLIAFPAAIITIVILVVMAATNGVSASYDPESPNLVLLIPYILVLIGGICGINVFIVLLAGIVTSVIIKLALGIKFMEILVSMGGGATGMFEVIMVTVLVSMLSALMKSYGGFDAILYGIKKVFKGKVGGQLGISVLVSVMDVATANNTVAIVMAAPIAKDISLEYGISPKRTASLLDIFGSIVQGIIPYGAQMIYATTAITVALEAGVITESVSAGQIISFLFYPYILMLCTIVSMFIITKKDKPETEESRLTIEEAKAFFDDDDYMEDDFLWTASGESAEKTED
ncbi:MAG: Na+/H+ antiporter NhaC family protein [Clostridia bacterium]|nr:Na+/H+ antiporter NhaC family protein [Clostridia bacterium]